MIVKSNISGLHKPFLIQAILPIIHLQRNIFFLILQITFSENENILPNRIFNFHEDKTGWFSSISGVVLLENNILNLSALLKG